MVLVYVCCKFNAYPTCRGERRIVIFINCCNVTRIYSFPGFLRFHVRALHLSVITGRNQREIFRANFFLPFTDVLSTGFPLSTEFPSPSSLPPLSPPMSPRFSFLFALFLAFSFHRLRTCLSPAVVRFHRVLSFNNISLPLLPPLVHARGPCGSMRGSNLGGGKSFFRSTTAQF